MLSLSRRRPESGKSFRFSENIFFSSCFSLWLVSCVFFCFCCQAFYFRLRSTSFLPFSALKAQDATAFLSLSLRSSEVALSWLDIRYTLAIRDFEIARFVQLLLHFSSVQFDWVLKRLVSNRFPRKCFSKNWTAIVLGVWCCLALTNYACVIGNICFSFFNFLE